jgi:hypothetical protein
MGNSGSILPWNDWIYHVSDLQDQVQRLHSQAVSAQDSIRAQVPQYNTLLDQSKQLLTANAALVIIARAIKFDDLQLKDFETQLQALPEPPAGCVPAQFGSFLSEMTGSFLVLKAVVNLGKLAKTALFPASSTAGGGAIADAGVEAGAELGMEGLAEGGTELGVEAGVEVGAEAALAETGIGIIAAVAINGAKQRDELNDQISKLNTAINQLDDFQTKLRNKFDSLNAPIVTEENRFRGVVIALQAIMPYQLAQDWQGLPVDEKAIGQYLAAQMAALRYYGLMSQLRITYLKAKERAPTASKEAIISAVLVRAKADVTHGDLEKLWDVLQKYSNGMKAV